MNSGIRAAKELLQNKELDCIFCSNELMALGALQTLTDKGIRIPDQIGFLTWDNPPWAKFSYPQISVISQPTYEIGTIAAETIMRRINSDDQSYGEPLEITLHAKMIKRSSLLTRR